MFMEYFLGTRNVSINRGVRGETRTSLLFVTTPRRARIDKKLCIG